MCQRIEVLKYLRTHAAIDQHIASKELAISRLAPRILELRKAGHPITSEMVEVRNRFGETCRVARYKLEQAA